MKKQNSKLYCLIDSDVYTYKVKREQKEKLVTRISRERIFRNRSFDKKGNFQNKVFTNRRI